jgi:hypothetical protein
VFTRRRIEVAYEVTLISRRLPSAVWQSGSLAKHHSSGNEGRQCRPNEAASTH